MTLPHRRPALALLLSCLLLACGAAARAQSSLPPPAAAPYELRSASLPAQRLFVGEQLTMAARQKLTELIIDAAGLQIEVVLIAPVGPWRLDNRSTDERALTPARLDAVKRFLTERGMDPRHIFVESRIDQSTREPRLDVQVGGRAATD